MDLSESVVVCAILVEWLNKQGSTIRKLNYKFGTIRLIRNDIREMFVEISQEKCGPIKFRMKGICVHKKFMNEGKASLKFLEDNCTVFLSNAPPGPLIAFLRTVVIKISNEQLDSKEDISKNLRAHLMSANPNSFEDISPVTNAELVRTKKTGFSRTTTTTPSPPQSKRRRVVESENESNRNGTLVKNLEQSSFRRPLTSTEDSFQKLNEEQTQILQTCLQGKNVFFTGSAGTGKSFLLRKIISTFPPDGTTATASTGVAACLIGGVTLHSFCGIGDGESTIARCFELAMRSASATNWRRCKRLIIDEISMIDGKYFEKIEAVARHVRRNDKPFGGIQLILCGDFLQLPPVTKQSFDRTTTTTVTTATRFCFQSPAWGKCIDASFELKQVHRQKDSSFVRILNLIRIGHVTDEISKTLIATGRQVIESDGILATQLCSHTNDANSINESKLEALTGLEKVFDAQDSDPNMKKLLDLQVPAPGKLVLKIGAQVMLLKNINLATGLVNGARGVVKKYNSCGYPLIKLKNGQEYVAKPEKWTIKVPTGSIITRRQVPLKLAWAFSIHKSQGLTLDCVEMSLSKVFEAGHAYVALSRAQSLESLRVLDFNSRQVWANQDVLQYYKQFRREIHSIEYMPLGGEKKKQKLNGNKMQTSLQKLKKNLLSNKPLLNIS